MFRKFTFLLCSLICGGSLLAQDGCPVVNNNFGKGLFTSDAALGDSIGRAVAAVGDVDGDGVEDYAYRKERDVRNSDLEWYGVEYRSGATHEALAYVDIDGTVNSQFFGYQIGKVGDIDGDGLDESYIANYTAIFTRVPGKVHIVSPLSGKVHYTLTSGEERDDNFGDSVAAVGDLNGDNISEILVGAPDAEGPACRDKDCFFATPGGAYLYDGRTGALIWESSGPLGEESSSFGSEVAALGDIDGDGFRDFGIADNLRELTVLVSGRLALLGADREIAEIAVALPENISLFVGQIFADLGDLNGDGRSEFSILFEQRQEDSDETFHVLNAITATDEGDLELLYKITRPNDDYFGAAITHVGDVDKDGLSDFAVSSTNLKVDDDREGIVEVFSGYDGSIIHTFFGQERGDAFGYDMAYLGDLNGDGFGELLISDPSSHFGPNYDFSNHEFILNRDYRFDEDGFTQVISLSIDGNGDGVLDVCEIVPEPEVPEVPGDEGINPGTPGQGSGGGSTGGGSGTPSDGEEVKTTASYLQAMIEQSYLAQKKGRKNRLVRRTALGEINMMITLLNQDGAEVNQTIIKRFFKRARRKKKRKFWNKFRKKLNSMLLTLG